MLKDVYSTHYNVYSKIRSNFQRRFAKKNQIPILSLFYFITSAILGTYLGQNFLTDNKVRHRIADKVEKMYLDLQAKTLIEI